MSGARLFSVMFFPLEPGIISPLPGISGIGRRARHVCLSLIQKMEVCSNEGNTLTAHLYHNLFPSMYLPH
ncbi:Hypothetical predicted protein [Podarcis lilfordi]|uniref:Uncharacterized protein n=1 Tax=Podarcis lilfordi TaxID=74358 RepID=A0AA35L5V3_9SAUR|nr:Hypothetical predicted protein [Podarcis lilfordi]